MSEQSRDSNVTYHGTSTMNQLAAIKRISWAAVFAGVILALVIELLLTMLGVGIGTSTIDPLQGGSPGAKAMGIGAGIWWAISSLIALFVGGWIAGRLAGIPRSSDAAIHGLLTWGLSTLLAFYLFGSLAGSVISGASSIVKGVATTAGAGVAAVAPQVKDIVGGQLEQSGISLNDIKSEARKLLRQTGKPALQPSAIEKQASQATAESKQAAQQSAANPAATDEEFDAMLDRWLKRGKATASTADRDALINVVVARTGMSRDEADKTIQNWETTYQQAQAKAEQLAAEAKQKTLEVADATAAAVSRTALWGFVALVLGAIAAAIGGSIGRPRELIATSTVPSSLTAHRTPL